MSPYRTILLVAAMEQESRPLIESLGFKPAAASSRFAVPFSRFEAILGETRLILSLNGKDRRYGNENVGLEMAALNTYDAIHAYSPDLVINFGTAGAFKNRGAEVGVVFLSKDRFFFHDHRIPLSGYEDYGRGYLPGLDVESFAQALSLPTGIVSSGSSLDFTDRDLEEIHRNGATLKEMEAAGIAWSCYLTGTPFFAIKSVTNIVDKAVSSANEFEKNFSVAVESLTTTTRAVLEAIVRGELLGK
jgi:nucleoside phosphorylase